MSRWSTATLITCACMVLGLLSGCHNSNQEQVEDRVIAFNANTNTLEARLVTPKKHQSQDAIVLLVHGDGAMDHSAQGYFEPIVTTLTNKGYATMSWSKPGIGNSSGDWLAQTMPQRAEEVRSAIRYLRQNGYPNNPIGVLGFSQASWVLAELSNEPEIKFAALVGGAANWREQSQYTMWLRLIEEEKIHADDDGIWQEIAQLNELEYQLIKAGFDDYRGSDLHQHPFMAKPIQDEARFNFVRANIDSDVSLGFAHIQFPMLALFGDSDIRVDVEHSQQVFASTVGAADTLEQKVISNASHSLLKTDLPMRAALYLTADDFAPGALDTLVQWLDTHANGKTAQRL
ncbi:lysophospholipase [Pseudoalteromonas sp. DL2-H2.2]|uniref:alpha/beta hydrolase family protein n=1 Tax=Pseudoalteromonas sp. DL2-H2.2 TaxID=2908889 RepID=UPI001F205307|nr:alpha/beta hydrolase [Pseudoalteromonas sp. DL2-H2.2]MCF2907051.1 lysophospholipase [Pseudoalteromonas sp. DL2-H2.2]